MQRLFEPGAVELADPTGDPNRVVEVQEKVEELLGANRQRKEGIRQELLEQGAWALPGLINATYVWMNELKKSPPDREILSSLMADLAAGNPAAADLVFGYGVLETPFSTPRSVARKALSKMGWRPTSDARKKLRGTLRLYKQHEDTGTVIELYDVLLSDPQAEDFPQALDVCASWARKSLEPAGALLELLIRRFPQETSNVFVAVFLAVKDRYRDKNLARMLLDPVQHSLPASWVEGGGLLDVSEGVLPNTPSGRHTAVEYLWEYAVRHCRERDPQLWKDLFDRLHEQVREQSKSDVFRYWMQAVGKAGEVDYVTEQARAAVDNEQWGIQAALQLFFLERGHPSVRQALQDLELERPTRYGQAESLFDEITQHRKEAGDTARGSRIGRIR